jgi:hypothetical protein
LTAADAVDGPARHRGIVMAFPASALAQIAKISRTAAGRTRISGGDLTAAEKPWNQRRAHKGRLEHTNDR